jgi:two-component system cell cycle response regulator DivK
MSVPVPNPYILVVDDFSDGREMLAEYLGFRGHTVLQATDGTAALNMARERVPALILLDLAMAGVDGYEVARQLKADATTRSALIVAVTARVSVPDESRARAAGCDGFVAKPYDLTALADAIGSIMADGRKALRQLNASTPGGTPAPSTATRKLSRT